MISLKEERASSRFLSTESARGRPFHLDVLMDHLTIQGNLAKSGVGHLWEYSGKAYSSRMIPPQ